jgi:2-polyprenyl-3-methyl-5-hydroxy-6-metoxy-1,4-benzoquinol methylase
MPEYNQKPIKTLQSGQHTIASFLSEKDSNIDRSTVNAFGEEWQKFNSFDAEEIQKIGDEYFDIVDDKMMNKETVALDLGCGSGRWSAYLSGKVGKVEAIDPSASVYSAAQFLESYKNIRVTQASVDNIPFSNNTFDFLLCLGVLHHIPNAQKALNSAVEKIKPNGMALLYFYYNFENRGALFKFIFKLSDSLRKLISGLPNGLKKFICDLIAIFIYLPFVLTGRLMKILFSASSIWKKIPLSYYTNKSFTIIRNDALDRFGTPLEQRFSKKEITQMLEKSGLTEIHFSDQTPFWHCTARKKNPTI